MQTNPTTPQDRRAAPAVQQIDQLLNHLVISAPTESEALAAWQTKIAIKRELQALPDDQIEHEAARILRTLEGVGA